MAGWAGISDRSLCRAGDISNLAGSVWPTNGKLTDSLVVTSEFLRVESSIFSPEKSVGHLGAALPTMHKRGKMQFSENGSRVTRRPLGEKID